MEGRRTRSFPVDILELCILPRLSLKSLLRFRCVSVGWYDCISNDRVLALQQYQRNSCNRLNFEVPNNASSSERWKSQTILIDGSSISISAILPDLREFHIIASCYGLVALFCELGDQRQLFVGNPVFEDWTWIPSLDVRIFSEIGLAFDPVSTCYKVVFPYPTLPDTEVFIHSKSYRFGFKVFSSGTVDWTVSKSNVMLPNPNSFRGSPVCVSGCILYWMGEGEVLWYNTKTDCSGLISLPMRACQNGCGFDATLNDSNGSIFYTKIARRYEINLWSLTSDFQWAKSHHIKIQEILKTTELYDIVGDNPGLRFFSPIAFEGKVVFFMFEGRTVFGYNVETREKKHYPSLSVWRATWFLYKPSLFPTPGRCSQVFPWKSLYTNKEGYICFQGRKGTSAFRINTRDFQP